MNASASPAPRTWVPPSWRAQIAGTIGILALAAFWGLLVPFVNSQVEGSNPFRAGAPFDLGGATVVPREGWVLGEAVEGVYTPIEKDGASLGIAAPADSTGTIPDRLANLAESMATDPTTTWEIGEPELFTTDAGTPAGRMISTSPDQVDIAYIVDDGTSTVVFGMRVDAPAWAALEADVDAMVRSTVLIAGAGEAAE